jgi:hypothetical protein
MPEVQLLAVIVAVGGVSVAMRLGGFLAAGHLPQRGALPRLLRLAPGNLCVAFSVAGMMEGGWPSVAGAAAAIGAMAVTNREWAALGAGFVAAALTAALAGG